MKQKKEVALKRKSKAGGCWRPARAKNSTKKKKKSTSKKRGPGTVKEFGATWQEKKENRERIQQAVKSTTGRKGVLKRGPTID